MWRPPASAGGNGAARSLSDLHPPPAQQRGGPEQPKNFPATLKWQSRLYCRQRPYRVECTGSLPTSEVKRRRARLVLGWGTAWESLGVLLAFFSPRFHSKIPQPMAEQRCPLAYQ